MEVLRTWILGLVAAALISGIALSITPKGGARRAVSLACGFLTIAVMIGPLRDFDFESYASFMVEFNSDTEAYGLSLENENDRLVRALIEEKSAAYILDKAAELGITGLQAEVGTKLGEGEYPYPWEATLSGEVSEEQKDALSNAIEAQLGIPAERLHWELDK